ncbi:MAG: hypothetical protein ACRBFS_15060 [Aureispira sp.]
MKLTILLFIITVLLLVFSYQQVPQQGMEGQPTVSSQQTPSIIDSNAIVSDTIAWGLLSSDSEIDSINLALALNDAFRVASPSFKAERFTSAYTFSPTDTSEEIDIEITVGKLLGTPQTYFLLRRWYSGTEEVYLDFYHIQADSSQLLLHHQQDLITYQKDTILDVNGDQQQDFVVHWYPSAGSWSREVYTVYLNTTNNTSFAGPYTFMNPTFSPTEGLIRGRAYGDPADAGFYKYQWNGLQVDTLEYLYPHPGQVGKYFRTNQETAPLQADNGTILDSLPLEYRGL